MTLRELWMLVLRHWVLVVVIVVVSALLCGGYALMADSGESYEAEARIIAGSNVNSVAGFAENAVRDMQDSYDSVGTVVNVSTQSNLMTVVVSATGPNPEECVRVANVIAETANELAVRVYSENQNPYQGEIGRATEAIPVSSERSIKFLLIGFVIGVFIAIGILILMDFRKRMVKTAEAAGSLVDLPILEALPAKDGDRLLANVRFANRRINASNELSSVLVVPVGQQEYASKVTKLISDALNGEEQNKVKVTYAPPIAECIDGAYASWDADLVVVVVVQWIDSLSALASSVDELRFANARIAGLVFCKEASC